MLGVLFLGLACLFAVIAVAAALASVWIVSLAASVIGLWLATTALGALRPR
jgi:hypothetical protein